MDHGISLGMLRGHCRPCKDLRRSIVVSLNRDRFEAGTPAARALPMIVSTVSGLKALTASLASSENRLREFSRAKAAARRILRRDVEAIYHTARAIASETPGFDVKFRMPLKGDAKLLNAAGSAAHDAEPLAAMFIKHAMPPDFLRPPGG